MLESGLGEHSEINLITRFCDCVWLKIGVLLRPGYYRSSWVEFELIFEDMEENRPRKDDSKLYYFNLRKEGPGLNMQK